jgi:hypothetical protein
VKSENNGKLAESERRRGKREAYQERKRGHEYGDALSP